MKMLLISKKCFSGGPANERCRTEQEKRGAAEEDRGNEDETSKRKFEKASLRFRLEFLPKL